ncbi:hypothetical protein D3C84_398360 [compost metagenome]
MALLVEPAQHVQLGIRSEAATGVLDAQLATDAGDHGRAVSGEQQQLPATRAAGIEQGGGVFAQAVVEDEPGQRTLLVAQQQPLALVAGNGRCRLAAEFGDESGLADAQAA